VADWSAADSGYQAERVTIHIIPVSEPFPTWVVRGRMVEAGSVSGREEAPGRRVHDQDRLSDQELPPVVYPYGVDLSTLTLRYLSACLRTRRRAAGRRAASVNITLALVTTLECLIDALAELAAIRGSSVPATVR
jgi:hypothetical protein